MSEIKEIISSDDMVSFFFEACRLEDILRVPKSVPAGKILVHKHMGAGLRSSCFRIWFTEPSSKYEVCPCEWAPELGVHYRVAAAEK